MELVLRKYILSKIKTKFKVEKKMKVEQKGNTTILKNTQGNTKDFFEKVKTNLNAYKKQNLILDLNFDTSISIDDLKLFQNIIEATKKNKKSIILVTNALNLNKVPKEIPVAPTLLEANDLIEMEEIERDLGF